MSRLTHRTDDDFDAGSITGQFFRQDSEPAPVLEETEETSPRRAQLSPSALARRARFRQLVTGVVSFASVISIAVVGKTLASPRRPAANVPVASVGAVAPVVPTADLPVKLATKPEPIAPPSPEPPKAVAAATATASAEEKAVDEKPADSKPAPTPAEALALKKETESLLNRGRTKEAIVKAREAIEADPSDAMPYLYLGSALQDSGKWKDAIEAYSQCVRVATKGPVNECRAVGGHK
jgi:hypothetical protein